MEVLLLGDVVSKFRCSICLSDDVTDPAQVMPCNHQFCFQCIKNWTQTDISCPNCRRSISSIVLKVEPPSVCINVENDHGYKCMYRYPVNVMFLPSMFDHYWQTCHPLFKGSSVLREDVFFYYDSHNEEPTQFYLVEGTDTPKSLGMAQHYVQHWSMKISALLHICRAFHQQMRRQYC